MLRASNMSPVIRTPIQPGWAVRSADGCMLATSNFCGAATVGGLDGLCAPPCAMRMESTETSIGLPYFRIIIISVRALRGSYNPLSFRAVLALLSFVTRDGHSWAEANTLLKIRLVNYVRSRRHRPLCLTTAFRAYPRKPVSNTEATPAKAECTGNPRAVRPARSAIKING